MTEDRLNGLAVFNIHKKYFLTSMKLSTDFLYKNRGEWKLKIDQNTKKLINFS